MANRKRNEWPKIIKRGNATVRIYRLVRKKRGRTYTEYKLSYYDDRGARKMESFSELPDAEARAGEVAAAITRGDAKLLLTLNREDELIYKRAKDTLENLPSPVPLDVAVSEFVKAKKELDGGDIVAAAKYFKATHHNFTPRTVEQVVEEFIALRKGRTVKGRPASDAYLRDLNTRLAPFAESFQSPIHTVTSRMIEDYIAGGKFEGRSRHNTLRVIRTLMRYAKAKRYLPRDADPLDGIEMRFEDEGEIEVFTPDEMRRLLHAAQEHHPHLLGFLAVGAFAGLRSAEIARLTWDKVAADYITVDARKAKTRSRRLVPVQPNLYAWLNTLTKDSATVASLDAINHGFSALTDSTKTDALPAVVWKKNGLRHSFITYRFVVRQDEGAVAAEAGNSPNMIHRHYRGLASEAAAKEWFSIKP